MEFQPAGFGIAGEPAGYQSGQVNSNELAALRRLWPNREHESNWLKGLLCAFGLHRWHTLTINASPLSGEFDFCRSCPEIRPHR
jgi:hypothetical protein